MLLIMQPGEDVSFSYSGESPVSPFLIKHGRHLTPGISRVAGFFSPIADRQAPTAALTVLLSSLQYPIQLNN
jgi:hypothetical protein